MTQTRPMKTLLGTFLGAFGEEAHHFLWCDKQTGNKLLVTTLPLFKESLPENEL